MLDILKSLPKGEPVAAISLRQPWATAVGMIEKDVENRSRWKYGYRGPIIIHASKSQPAAEDFEFILEVLKARGISQKSIRAFNPWDKGFKDFLYPFGAIVAVANLAEVFGPDHRPPKSHPVTESLWAQPDAPYHLYFDKVESVEPVPFKGAVGLFKVPYTIAASLEGDNDDE